MKYLVVLLIIINAFQRSPAQQLYTEHTLTAENETVTCACKLEQLSWMAGNWKGDEDGVMSEEQWTQPVAGTMTGMYRMVVKGKPLFYELMLLIQDSTGIKLQLKHFWHPLKGWEEKDAAGVVFKLLKVEGTKALFDRITYELVGGDDLIVSLAETVSNGDVKEEIFRMKKSKK